MPAVTVVNVTPKGVIDYCRGLGVPSDDLLAAAGIHLRGEGGWSLAWLNSGSVLSSNPGMKPGGVGITMYESTR